MKKHLVLLLAVSAVVLSAQAAKNTSAKETSKKAEVKLPKVESAIETKKAANTTVVASNTTATDNGSSRGSRIVSIDSIRLLKQSKEGQKLEAEVKKEIEEFENSIRKANNEIIAEQESLSKQASLLNKDALQEKAEQLMMKKNETEKKFVAKRDGLTESFQRRHLKLRDKQVALVRDYFEKEEGCDLFIDKNTPGIISVSKNIDKTDISVKIVDNKYEGTNVLKSKESIAKASKDDSVDAADEKTAIRIA